VTAHWYLPTRRSCELAPPSFSPDTGLFLRECHARFSVYYIFDEEEKPEGWAATTAAVGPNRCCRRSTTKPAPPLEPQMEGGGIRSGVLSTAGICCHGDTSSNLVALTASTGQPLWHANLGAGVSNGP